MPPKTRPPPQYQYFEVRLESFTNPQLSGKGPLAASQSRRGAKPKAWPHSSKETFSPENLAKAGFYFNPSEQDPDNCTCFLCGKSLGGWVKGDIPYREHFSHDESECGWARAVCQVKAGDRLNGHGSIFVFSSEDRLPTSEALVTARHDTYSQWWPHDRVAEHEATSEKMAEAGFHYTPDSKANDLVSCVYCGTELDGWEPADDPLDEHRRKEPNCVFFTAGDRVGVKVSIDDPPPEPAPKTNGTTKKAAKPISSQTVTSQPPRSQSTRSLRGMATDSETEPAPPQKGRRATAATRSREAPASEVEVSASDAEPEPVPVPTKTKGKGKGTKATSKSTSASTSEPAADAEDPPKKKRGRPPKKKPEPEPEPETEPAQEEQGPEPKIEPDVEAVEVTIQEPPPKKRGRSKKVKLDDERPIAISEDDAATAKPPRSRGKAATLSAQPSITAEPSEPVKVPRSRSKQALVSVSEASDAEPDKSKRAKAPSIAPADLRKSTRTRAKPDMTSESEVEIVAPPLGRSTRSRPAQAEVQSDDLALSGTDLSEEPTAKPRANGKAKATAKNKAAKSTKPKKVVEPIPAEPDIEMEDAPGQSFTVDQFVQQPGQSAPSGSEEDEDSDVEEVERTIMEVPRPALTEAAPATPVPDTRVAPSLPGSSLPIPSLPSVLPLPPISTFTEAELSMTLEEWVRHETRRQYEVLRAEGERRIADFVEKARVVRSRIEAL